MKRFALAILLAALAHTSVDGRDLELSFRTPPESTRPWVFWFWMNGNISREGITKDLESMKRVGIGGVLWMEVSGPWWAPQGPIEAGSQQWHDAMQWAISEAERLGLAFALSVDFGYGSGGPHITPDLSMQKLVASETKVSGGRTVILQLKKPVVDFGPELKKVWLRPGQSMNPVVMKALEEVDSYRDVAVFAIPSPEVEKGSLIPDLQTYDGRGWTTHLPSLSDNHKLTSVARDDVIDLSDRISVDGHLQWDAPRGDWTVIRLGYASNFKMTRPSPQAAVGLECDRLHPRGINAHFEHQLKPILEAAGKRAGRTLQYIHIDSWEALGQNWTAGFAEEFQKRRGYDIRPWLPVLVGCVVESEEMTDRFLWDMRQTVSELTLSCYIDRLRELIAPYGVQFSCEPYGRLCVDQLTYGGRGDFPICEFWTERKIQGPFPTFSDYWYMSMKGLASVANTYGKSRVGAEAFTGARGWVDHPYLIKGMGDEAFCNGVSQYIFHLSAHQPYDHMKPGLTHRKWGQHFNRHQTWWEFGKPYFDYVTRCQFLLQQGRRVVDVACLYHEGAPLNFNEIHFEFPGGHDYDFCSSEIIQQMEVEDGLIVLPSGVKYRYLVLPKSGQLTLPTACKVDELHKAGASVYAQEPIVGTPGLEGYPEANDSVKQMAAKWPLLPSGSWHEVFAQEKLEPDFEGNGIRWIHRRTKDADIYFLANSKRESIKRECSFRVTGRTPQLWDPETGRTFGIPVVRQTNGCTTARIEFEPWQSWFVVFLDENSSTGHLGENPFSSWHTIQDITGNWSLTFDPAWGPNRTMEINGLRSWSEHPDPLAKYYSGTANYVKLFDVSESARLDNTRRYCLDLGQVEVMAHVTLNGKDCGIAWKPPYRVDITRALTAGQNKLEVEVVNTWVNRMIGDEQLPIDAKWKNWETLVEWPDWFKQGRRSPTGRYTFTTARHYKKDSPLQPSGLLGPVRILSSDRGGTRSSTSQPGF